MNDRLEEIEADLNRRTPATDFEDRSHCRELLEIASELRTDRDHLAATVGRVKSMIPELEADIPEDNGNATAHHIAKRLRAAIEGTES